LDQGNISLTVLGVVEVHDSAFAGEGLDLWEEELFFSPMVV
jgi:hypothetical protein